MSFCFVFLAGFTGWWNPEHLPRAEGEVPLIVPGWPVAVLLHTIPGI